MRGRLRPCRPPLRPQKVFIFFYDTYGKCYCGSRIISDINTLYFPWQSTSKLQSFATAGRFSSPSWPKPPPLTKSRSPIPTQHSRINHRFSANCSNTLFAKKSRKIFLQIFLFVRTLVLLLLLHFLLLAFFLLLDPVGLLLVLLVLLLLLPLLPNPLGMGSPIFLIKK